MKIYDEAKLYAENILSNKIISCDAIKHACERYINDLLNPDLYIDTNELDLFQTFSENIYHFTGRFDKQPFILSDWQCFFIANILGLRYKETKLRRYQKVYLQVARKNGKTSLICLLSLFELLMGDTDPQIIVCAPSLEQSRINLYQTGEYLKSVDGDGKYVKTQYNKIKNTLSGGKLQIRAADYKRLDGENNSLCILDECHQLKDCQQVLEVLRSGQGSRENPLQIIITTAGLDTLNYTYTGLYSIFKQMLNKTIIIDEKQFILIYELDELDVKEEKYLTDFSLIKKSNPNVGISVSEQFIIDEIKTISIDSSKKTGVLTKNLNIWVDNTIINNKENEIYIPLDVVRANMQPINIDDYEGCYAFIGVDLSSVSDLNCVSVMIPNYNGKHIFKNYYFVPEKHNNNHQVTTQIKHWNENKYIYITEGNCLDSLFIVKFINELSTKLNIIECGLDLFNSSSFQNQMSEINPNIYITPIKQSFLAFNNATKEFKIMMLKNEIILDQNSVTMWNFSNAELIETNNGNQKVMKKNNNKANKIDGVIAAQQALMTFISSNYINVKNK